MKKLIFTFLFIVVISFASQAQSRVGVGLAYGSEIENLGIGVNGEFAASDVINIAPSFIYYLEKNNVTFWELNGNINYILSENSATVYGIAGLNLTGISVDFSEFGGGKRSDSELGLNLGIGANFDIGGSAIPFAEAKYVLGDADQLSLFGGVRFPLN